MKNWKWLVVIGFVAVVGLVGCDNGSTEEPIAKTYTISDIDTAAGPKSANVVVNYMALPSATKPAYMDTLEAVVKTVLAGSSATNNLTINIVSGGVDGFVMDSSKTIKARESWIAKATHMDMGISLTSVESSWIAIVKSNVYLAFAGGAGVPGTEFV